jgi:polar amino acid transport system substrate-binding protein
MLVSSAACGNEQQDKQDVINIKVVTEDTFPLQYLENGKVTGPATNLVEQVLLAAGVTYNIEVLPWARAYQLALTEPNILIYSLAKTTARLNAFKWVGKITALDYYLYGAVDSEINLQTSLEDLKQYEIGTVRDSAVYQYLQVNGFNKLTTVVQGRQNFLLFEQNRIDLFPANKSSFQAICMQDAFNCHNLKPLYKLDISSIELYIAFSQLTDDVLVEKIRAGYTKVMKKRNNSHDIGIN